MEQGGWSYDPYEAWLIGALERVLLRTSEPGRGGGKGYRPTPVYERKRKSLRAAEAWQFAHAGIRPLVAIRSAPSAT